MTILLIIGLIIITFDLFVSSCMSDKYMRRYRTDRDIVIGRVSQVAYGIILLFAIYYVSTH